MSYIRDSECEKSKPAQRFMYNQLDLSESSIRLVNILPDLSDNGLLQCRLIHASTGHHYVCLSYVWDYSPQSDVQNGARTKEILINGSLYSVRENLFGFLSMARHNGARDRGDPRRFDLSVPIWIDALCIDQSNPREGNHQVAQMDRIYSGASMVHSWLGKADPDHDLIELGLVNNGTNLSDPKTLTVQEQVDVLLQDLVTSRFWSMKMDEKSKLLETHPVCHLTAIICGNRYWKRAWVIQEILSAKRNMFWIESEPEPDPSGDLETHTPAGQQRHALP